MPRIYKCFWEEIDTETAQYFKSREWNYFIQFKDTVDIYSTKSGLPVNKNIFICDSTGFMDEDGNVIIPHYNFFFIIPKEDIADIVSLLYVKDRSKVRF